MSEHTATSHVAHHFQDAEQQFEASTLGMWAFLITEVMFFGGLFAGYAIYRASYPEAFVEGSHHLDITLGALNTAILICSSLTMAMAVYYAQQGKRQALITFLVLTLVLGTAFLGIKAVEYSHKYHEHLIPGPSFNAAGATSPHVQMFFSFYFGMTGLHALHMIIGAGILLVLLKQSWQGRFTSAYSTPIEIFGLYWHFVDIVWIFLFPLLYLIGRH